MCGFCGVPAPPPHWFDAGVIDTIGGRARARAQVLQMLSRLLASIQVSVCANPSMPSIMLRAADGRCRVVKDLTDIWIAVFEIQGTAYDPLGRHALQYLSDSILEHSSDSNYQS